MLGMREGKENKMYNVVFEYTEGCVKGCRTWTTYDSKEQFNNWWEEYIGKDNEFIVEEDVSVERAKELIDEIPMDHVALAMMRKEIKELVEGITGAIDLIKQEKLDEESNG